MSEDPIEVVVMSDMEDPDPDEFVETDQQINTSYMENSIEYKEQRRNTT